MKLDAGRYAAAFCALFASHHLADHVVQTDHQAAGKGVAGPVSAWAGPMAGHIGSYTATQAIALGGLHVAGVKLRPGAALAALAISAGTHAFLDRRWPVVELLRRTGSDRFADPDIGPVDVDVAEDGQPFAHRHPLPLHGPYLADQALHIAVLAIVAGIAAR